MAIARALQITAAAALAVGGARGVRPAAAEPAPLASCVDDAAPYDHAALRGRIAQLASKALDGRASGTIGDAATRAILVARFRCLGLQPGGADGSYEQPFTAEGRATANVIGYLPGRDDIVGKDIIVVGAHHDHLGDGHLGANDNASGVAGLLAIAQALQQRGSLDRTVAFVAFGGEELGLHGSAHFVAHPPAALPLDRVVYNVNLDMIGSYSSTRRVHAMGTFASQPATALVQALTAKPPALRIAFGGRGSGSDHDAFCRRGIPYVFFWTPDKRCYHARCDTVDQLDLPSLAHIARIAGDLVDQLAQSPLDLEASRNRLGCTGRR